MEILSKVTTVKTWIMNTLLVITLIPLLVLLIFLKLCEKSTTCVWCAGHVFSVIAHGLVVAVLSVEKVWGNFLRKIV